jgi:polyisoprenyl-phosphate glycosyltransferase
MSKKLLSFVLPMYNESKNIKPLFEELLALQKKLAAYECEFIFINDHSKDNTLLELQKLAKKYPKLIKIVAFSRNFGHQIAVTAGQDIAKGEAVVVMDTDLQDPPSVVLDLVKKWEQGFDVVYAKRRKYKTNFFKEKSAWLFYRILCKISSVDIPVDTGDFRLLSRRVNEEMKKYTEKSRYLRGISSLVGFRHTEVLFDRQDRLNGDPGYTFIKSLKLAIDGITGFSVAPIRLISMIGAVFAIFSFGFGFLYVLASFIKGDPISGWASTITAIYFLGGVQLLMLGILGEYIGRIFIQSLNRPLYTIDNQESYLD